MRILHDSESQFYPFLSIIIMIMKNLHYHHRRKMRWSVMVSWPWSAGSGISRQPRSRLTKPFRNASPAQPTLNSVPCKRWGWKVCHEIAGEMTMVSSPIRYSKLLLSGDSHPSRHLQVKATFQPAMKPSPEGKRYFRGLVERQSQHLICIPELTLLFICLIF